MNKSDSERTCTVIERMGYTWTDSEEDAHMLGLLACSVRQKSIDKVYTLISKWNKWKNKRNLLTFVSGCMLPADKEKFLKLFDLVFTIEELPGLEDMIRQYGIVTPATYREGPDAESQESTIAEPERTTADTKTHGPPIDLSTLKPAGAGQKQEPAAIKPFWNLKPHYSSSFEAFIPIQNGCDKFCTFCAVPYTRGREVSRPSAEILDELKTLVGKGYKSITLLGQNVNSYGLDRQGDEIPFHELLRKIGEFGDKSDREFWVYFTSPHPRDMSEEVVDIIATHNCLAKQIHLPVQSGDDRVLISMNRNHSVDRYRKIAGYIRERIPQATLSTDIIVGFTGETNAHFENTRLLMEEMKFNMAYIAIYSPRPGATSSRWADDVPLETKKERLHSLTEELVKHNRISNQNLIGNKVRVLVTGKDRKNGYLKAHTEGRLIIRFASEDGSLIGNFTDLKISSASDFSLEGDHMEIFTREMNEA